MCAVQRARRSEASAMAAVMPNPPAVRVPKVKRRAGRWGAVK